MKAIYVYALPQLTKHGSFHKYHYLPWRHPVAEWAEVFKADALGNGFRVDALNWKEYDLAICFLHGGSSGSAKLIRKLNPKIKILSILEPPPEWLLSRASFGNFQKMKEDVHLSDIVGVAHEVYVDDWRTWFGSNNMHFLPVPINIKELGNWIDLSKRENIVAMTTHCNFLESSIRTWKVINEVRTQLSKSGYRIRCFYASDPASLIRLGMKFHETCQFIWDYRAHLPRLNQCKIFVDDNICAASGHMALEMMCLGIPSVGSNDFIDHLFPELGMKSSAFGRQPYRDQKVVNILATRLLHLAQDEDFYKQMVERGKKRLSLYSYESCRKRAVELLGL